jgi:hypothetical protein
MHLRRQNECEATLLAEHFPPLPFDRASNRHYASAQTVWRDGHAIDVVVSARPLVAHQAPEWRQIDGVWAPTPDYDFRYVLALVDDAARVLHGEQPHAMADWRAAQQRTREPVRHLNPQAHCIREPAYVAHRRLRRSARRELRSLLHATRLRVPRLSRAAVVPAARRRRELAKLHLIREHLPQHDFVFWVDADILAIDQRQPVDGVIDGRDFVIGTDHTAWAINSCMIGVRNVAPMHELVGRICARIESFDDRSSVRERRRPAGDLR